MKCLAKERDRWQSAAGLASELGWISSAVSLDRHPKRAGDVAPAAIHLVTNWAKLLPQ